MQNMNENIMGTCFQAPSKAVEKRKNQRYGKQRNITYLGLIAYVLQKSPDKMLTFSRLMDELVSFVSGDRKGIENNIRVCLSSNSCFVKVPFDPDMTYSKGNFWKVDMSRITAKMARRNFKGILDQFPELSTKVKMEAKELSGASERTARTSSTTPMCSNIQTKTESKFTSSFSIESLLNRDSPRVYPQIPSLPVVSSLATNQGILQAEPSVRTKRRMSWDLAPIEMHGVPCLADSHMVWSSTEYGVIGHDAKRTFKKMRMCTEPSYPTYFRPSAPCFAELPFYPEYEVGYPVHM